MLKSVTETQGISDYYIEDAWMEELDGEYFDADNTNVEVVWTSSTVSGIGVNVTLLRDMPQATTVSLQTKYLHFSLTSSTKSRLNVISSLTETHGSDSASRKNVAQWWV